MHHSQRASSPTSPNSTGDRGTYSPPGSSNNQPIQDSGKGSRVSHLPISQVLPQSQYAPAIIPQVPQISEETKRMQDTTKAVKHALENSTLEHVVDVCFVYIVK